MMLLHVLDGGPVTPADLWRRWRVEPVALVLIVITATAYGVGLRRLWHNARSRRVITTRRATEFYAGILTLLVALCSPLDALADSLFSAHMVQHVLLIAVAAPLLVAGIPGVPLVWALPDASRRAFGPAWNRSGLGRLGHSLTRPFTAWALHTLALWLWHVPGPYGAALAHPAIHALEHACFLVTAIFVWQAALRPLGHQRRDTARGLLVLGGTLAQSSALGAWLTLSSTPWYYAQSVGAGAWHMTALADQQLAGIIMWIPASFIYVGAMLLILSEWLREPRATPVPARDAAPYLYPLH